jgi:PKD repeat protein
VLTKKILATFVLCVMVAVAAVPAVIGADGEGTPIGPAEHVERLAGLGSPRNSATEVTYEITEGGMLGFTIDWYGLSAVKLEVYDVTDGSEVIILSERIRAPKDGSSVNSTTVRVGAGDTIKVVAIPGGGPGKGDYAEMTPILYPVVLVPPVAMFTATPVSLTVSLDASGSYDPDGMVVAWDWELGDGSTASGEMVTYTYSASGTYTITLTVTDNDGLTDSTSQDVYVEEEIGPTATYTVSGMGEMYVKSTDPADLGRRSTTPGWNSWQPLRNWGYGEAQITMDYPYVLGWPVYSPNTGPDVDAGFALTTYYRLNMVAENVDTIGTAAGMDPLFISDDLDATLWGGDPASVRDTWDGGTMSIDWYGTYLTGDELAALKSGTDWRNSYYGIPARTIVLNDDGWWHELHGTITMDVASAQKYLGLAGVDLTAEFNTANTGGTIQGEMMWDWALESGQDGAGETDGIYDIYCAYDYSNDIRYMRLTAAPESTADTLVLRMWTVSWGNEIYMCRLVEASGLANNWLGYWDDMSLSATFGLTSSSVTLDTQVDYHMTAWQDSGTGGAAWSLEATHVDYCGNVFKHEKYVSPYTTYDPDVTDVKRMSYLPGTTAFGTEVSYWNAPMEWDLASGETLIVQLPTATFAGFTPVAGSGVMDDAIGLLVTGSLEAGTCYPDLSGYYNVGSKTYTLVGPIDFPTMVNSYGVLETGSPTFSLIVV